MAVGSVMVPQYTCERCGYTWIGRSVESDLPTTCAKCRSPNWDRPRKLLDQKVGTTHTSKLGGKT